MFNIFFCSASSQKAKNFWGHMIQFLIRSTRPRIAGDATVELLSWQRDTLKMLKGTFATYWDHWLCYAIPKNRLNA